ncbi:MAG: hypothetical protein HYV28_14535 [Ignavibacteriales bacterium]|nr:hypothetical protein [Ignavibacteriales bacterium]
MQSPVMVIFQYNYKKNSISIVTNSFSNSKQIDSIINRPDENIIFRLTALWGFSESVLGGLLHGLKLPVTGIFVGGSAVFFIVLIAYYSQNNKTVLQSMLTVLLIKFLISPFTPPAAYLAVFMQGLAGMCFFNIRKNFFIYSLWVGFFSLMFSALMKLVILTVLFGTGFWEAIDVFSKYVLLNFFHIKGSIPSVSQLLIGIYLSLHVVLGLVFGFIAGKLPKWIDAHAKIQIEKMSILETEAIKEPDKTAKKAAFKSKFLLLFIVCIVIASYFIPVKESFSGWAMAVRAILLILLWYYLLNPLITLLISKLFSRRSKVKQSQLDAIINLFPFFRSILIKSMSHATEAKGLAKIRLFLSSFIVLSVFSE